MAFEIDTTVILDLGGAKETPAAELDPRGGEPDARHLSDGRIVVKDRYSLKVFDAQGGYLLTVGRQGQGPGEFSYLYGLCVMAGDTIVGIDNQRASVFSPRGDHIRTFSVTRLGAGHLDRSGCFEDGSLLSIVDSRPDSSNPAYRNATGRVISTTGEDLSSIGNLEDGFTSTVVPSVPIAAIQGSQFFSGDGRQPEIGMYRKDGALLRLIRWRDPGTAVDAPFLREIMKLTVPGASDEQISAMVARESERPQPSTLPRYQEMKVDAAGRLWVFDYPDLLSLRDWQPVWTVFASDGQPIGRVILPSLSAARRKPDIASILENRVILRWTDNQLGFRHLTFHELRPVTPQAP